MRDSYVPQYKTNMTVVGFKEIKRFAKYQVK